MLNILSVQRSVAEDEIVQRAIIDDAIDELHVMRNVTIRLHSVQALELVLLHFVCCLAERLVLVAFIDQFSSCTVTFTLTCVVRRRRVRVRLMLGDLLALSQFRLLTVRSVDAEEACHADARDLIVKWPAALLLDLM